MTTRLITVILPVYNGAQYLTDALGSVQAQDYEPIEVIVVDDGSSDATAEVVRAFPAVRYVYQHNQGPAAARNRGLELATGELLAFLDADDIMLPHRLRTQSEFLDAHPEIDAVLGRHEIMLEPGAELPRRLARDIVFGDLDGVQPGSVMMRAWAVGAGGGFDPSYRVGEFMEWFARLREHGVRFSVLAAPVMKRRMHPGNLSHDREELRAELARGLKARIDRRRERSADG